LNAWTANGTEGLKMAYSRKTLSNAGDRLQLEQGEARVLYATWMATGKRVLTVERIEYLEKRYGIGCVTRIRQYMDMIKNGELT
jgi:hypothetical protein